MTILAHEPQATTLATEPVRLEWTGVDVPDITAIVSLGGSYQAYFSGELVGDDEPGELNMDYSVLYVDEQYRGLGLATRLVGSLAHVALAEGATSLQGEAVSQHTLKIFGKLFGDHAIRYYDIAPTNGEIVELSLTTKQAIQSLERAEEFELDLDDREHGIISRVDLSMADPDRFEAPIEL